MLTTVEAVDYCFGDVCEISFHKMKMYGTGETHSSPIRKYFLDLCSIEGLYLHSFSDYPQHITTNMRSSLFWTTLLTWIHFHKAACPKTHPHNKRQLSSAEGHTASGKGTWSSMPAALEVWKQWGASGTLTMLLTLASFHRKTQRQVQHEKSSHSCVV